MGEFFQDRKHDTSYNSRNIWLTIFSKKKKKILVSLWESAFFNEKQKTLQGSYYATSHFSWWVQQHLVTVLHIGKHWSAWFFFSSIILGTGKWINVLSTSFFMWKTQIPSPHVPSNIPELSPENWFGYIHKHSQDCCFFFFK